jgi:hypothetical protein
MQTILKSVLQSLLVGLIFVPLAFAFVFAAYLPERWEFGSWPLQTIWYVCGYPVIGIFAITSASHFVHKTVPMPFWKALILCTLGTFLCYFLGNYFELTPRILKGDEGIRWLKPSVLTWMLLPPWLIALTCFGFRKTQRNITQNSH